MMMPHEFYCALITMCYVNDLPAVSVPTIQLLFGCSHMPNTYKHWLGDV